MRKNNKHQKGFTLIELLVVIAIIAILAVVVVLTLNPAELLRQSRDSNRLSDFATLKSALGLYAADVATTTPMYGGAGSFGAGAVDLYTAGTSASTTLTSYQGATTTATWGFGTSTANYLAVLVATSTARNINGTGWIPLNFSAISSGAPIGNLPVDPTNIGGYWYMYGATSTAYKLAAKTESYKYSYNGPNDVDSTDGGMSSTTYEQGTNLAL